VREVVTHVRETGATGRDATRRLDGFGQRKMSRVTGFAKRIEHQQIEPFQQRP
jgi:hypothetical protein